MRLWKTEICSFDWMDMRQSKSLSKLFAESLILAPWWVSIILAGLVFVLLVWWFPALSLEPIIYKLLQAISPTMAYFISGMLLLMAGVSALRQWKVKTQFENQESLDSLIKLEWKEFEDLTAELFRRRGFKVEESLGSGADGGVDLRFRKEGEKTLVQCKRWKSTKVGLPVVRELLGAMTAENTKYGILVTTSRFTSEAQAFASQHSIELMDGESLLSEIKELKMNATSVGNLSEIETPIEVIPSCPKCGSEMVKRLAKKGPNAGNQFWGCKAFPKCRGTREI